LLVVGRPDPPALEEQLRRLAAADERVRLHLRFLDDEDLQYYLNATDLVVLPYRQVLNSGSALLALSFDRPVLVPRLGALEELQRTVGDAWVRTYRGAFTTDALDEALAWALARRPGPAPLDGLAWEGIAEATLAAFEMVASLAPPASAEPAVTTLKTSPHEQRT
jgi:glycosyltransferase involved in cell wall biosynthesis